MANTDVSRNPFWRTYYDVQEWVCGNRLGWRVDRAHGGHRGGPASDPTRTRYGPGVPDVRATAAGHHDCESGPEPAVQLSNRGRRPDSDAPAQLPSGGQVR